MHQKKTEQSALTIVYRAISLAFSYFFSSLERLHHCSEEGMANSGISANLGYAHRELEKAYRACLHIVGQIGKNNTANTIDFHNWSLARAVEKAGIPFALWKNTWSSVEESGLAATMENIAVDITHMADKVKKIGVRIESRRETKLSLESLYYNLAGEISALLCTASTVGLIADMADAIKSGRREVHGIMIPLKGENLMSEIHSREVVNVA